MTRDGSLIGSLQRNLTMNFQPFAVANDTANQILVDVTNGVGQTVEENAGKSAKRFKAALNLHTDRDASISLAELGQQAAFHVHHASLVPIAGVAAGAPAWAVAMQQNIINTINKNHEEVKAMINELREDMNIRFSNMDARHLNSFVSEEPDSLVKLTNNDGEQPPHFPQTYGAFFRLSAARITALLEFYGLPVADDAYARKVCLRCHLGIRTP